MPQVRYGYDVFLSHNSADKEWVRHLADRLASVSYNGRPLRPWLDENVLDPGLPSSNAELTSAMDLSRVLALVHSPEAIASYWVQFEIDYFNQNRGDDHILVLHRRPADLPKGLTTTCAAIDFEHADRFDALVAALCPPPKVTVEDVQSQMKMVFKAVLWSDPRGLTPGSTPEREALIEALLAFDPGDPGLEGAALAAFDEAAIAVQGLTKGMAPEAYNLKMLLGDCLASAVLVDPFYRQAMQRVVDLEKETSVDPALYWAVTRAASKLAETDPDQFDASTLLRVADLLDKGRLTVQRKALAMMIGRAIGKIRTQKLGELLIKTLSDMGPVSRIAVCVALSMTDRTADSVHYLSRLQETASGQEETDLPIPSQRMISLLSLISADYTDVVEPILRNAKFDLQKAYGIEDFPYPAFWTDVRHFDAPLLCHNGPFAGRVRLATTDNMVQLAREVNLADVVCLTEPRVVDALFDRAGAVLSAEPDVDAPRHRRLQGRSIPFAAVTPEAMAAVAKAHAVAASPERVSVMA